MSKPRSPPIPVELILMLAGVEEKDTIINTVKYWEAAFKQQLKIKRQVSEMLSGAFRIIQELKEKLGEQ